MKCILLVLFILPCMSINAQADPPLQSIPDYPADHGPGSMMARMVEGLGYRYHWATDSLTSTDLNYRPNAEARSSYETVEHIFDLSRTILDFAAERPSPRPMADRPMGFEVLRRLTLENLAEAARMLRGKTEAEVAAMTMSFERDGERSDHSMYHAINGPISDAIYHVGQLVTFRRITDNPIHSGVSVFSGKTRE